MSNGVSGLPLNNALDSALTVAATLGVRVFVVGGVVRDLLSHKTPGDYDLDIVVEGDGASYARALQEIVGGELKTYPAFLTAKLLAPFIAGTAASSGGQLSELDVASTRTEVYEKPGALPSVKAAPLEHDLYRRDFSINAMALPLNVYRKVLTNSDDNKTLLAEIVDPTGGLQDLQQCLVRILHPHSFRDDPTRLFRALRYCVRLGFELSSDTRAAFDAAVAAGGVAGLSPRRVWNELVASLDEALPDEVVGRFATERLLEDHGLVEIGDLPLLHASLRRLADLTEVGGAVRKQAGRLLLLHIALHGGRTQSARSVQEPKKFLESARAISSAEGVTDLATAVAHYALVGGKAARNTVQEMLCLREGA